MPEDSQLTVTKRHSRRILWRHVRRLDSIVPTEAQLELRPFQKEALAASLRRYGQGIRRQLIALPTGMGKTVIFANLREHHTMTKRTLVIVHREELANQALREFSKWSPKVAGIEMGSRTVGPEVQTIIASVQSLANRLDEPRFLPYLFDTIICDEAHHSPAPSYQRVFDHFGLLERDNDKLLLGVTATPFRNDSKLLGKTYDEIVYTMKLPEAIEQGWLVDIRGFTAKTDTNLDNVHSGPEDFIEGELEKAVNTASRNECIVRCWREMAENRQALVFTVNVQHAKDLAETFKYYGIPAEAVWGDDAHRKGKIEQHQSANLKVLCNCNVLTEGYDDWGIGCIVMARPTKSRLLFVQMAGRGLRIPEGISNIVTAMREGVPIQKKDCLRIDVVDNTRRHQLATLSTVLDLGRKFDFNGESVKQILAKKPKRRDLGRIDPSLLKRAENAEISITEVDLLGGRRSEMPWRQQWDASYAVKIDPGGELRVFRDLGGAWWAEGKMRGKIRFKVRCASRPAAMVKAYTEARRVGRHLERGSTRAG